MTWNQWATLILSVLSPLVTFLLGLFIHNYLPTYMEEKGKNLATKEDISEITRRQENVLQDFRKEFEDYSLDKHFKNDFFFKQYSQLYSQLYQIICQSEYVRFFMEITDSNKRFSFDNVPFIELNSEDHDLSGLQKYNKKELTELILSKGEYADQKLLKLATSYRFVYYLYSGRPNGKATVSEKADDEEIWLIREIVKEIVRYYNYLRKELKMDCIIDELETGVPYAIKYIASE